MKADCGGKGGYNVAFFMPFVSSLRYSASYAFSAG
jgi:hypothetical protein